VKLLRLYRALFSYVPPLCTSETDIYLLDDIMYYVIRMTWSWYDCDPPVERRAYYYLAVQAYEGLSDHVKADLLQMMDSSNCDGK
jgi:hypothetical protein